MKKMSTRERVLLVAFAVLLIGVLYYLLFLTPMNDKMDQISAEILDVEDEITAAQIRTGKMNSMQEELDKIFADAGGSPTRIPDYDNVQVVITELNHILAAAGEYSLDFGPLEDGANSIIRRPITLTFSSNDYATVRSILEQLGGSPYRCLITNVSIVDAGTSNTNYSVSGASGGYKYAVNANINYYEYSSVPVNPDTTAE